MRTPALLALATCALAAPAAAVPLEIVEVAAPAINCVFDADCRITVTDTSAPITLPGASGEGFLQSRTAPRGESGTTGRGFFPYEYRIDLRPIGGLTALPCITELALDFGPVQPLDYDGDGDAEEVFVVTAGGLGTVAPASADRVGDRITFRFAPAVCAGNRPGAGESTFFFGLAAAGPPRAVTAQAVVSLGGVLDLAARSPGGGPGGGGRPPGLESCLPGLPTSGDVPVCRCLRDPILRELRCGLIHPDFVLVRRTPLPVPPGPFAVRWSFAPLGGFAGSVVVADGLAPGFSPTQGAPPRLRFEAAAGQGGSQTREYRLSAAAGGEETLSVPSLVTVEPHGGQGTRGSFHLLLPIGPRPWPDLGDAPSEPLPRPPDQPDFGGGPCGRAADRRWADHVERFGDTPFGLSPAAHGDIQTRAARCRQLLPSFGVVCGAAGQAAWADCFLNDRRDCDAEAAAAIEGCRLFGIGHALDEVLGGLRPGLIDLGGP